MKPDDHGSRVNWTPRLPTTAQPNRTVGYTIHRTEACDDDTPRLITHVETTTAPVVDAAALPAVHAALRGRELLPTVQLVDSGSLDAPQIVTSQEDYQVALRGPGYYQLGSSHGRRAILGYER